MEDVKITEDFENQIVKLLSPKFKQELLVRKTVGPSAFFEVVWSMNDSVPSDIDGVFTSQSKAMEAALHFINHTKMSSTAKRDANTKTREARKAKQNKVVEDAAESNS